MVSTEKGEFFLGTLYVFFICTLRFYVYASALHLFALQNTGPLIFSIFANSTAGTVVGQIAAVDPDEWPRNEFRYYMTSGDGNYFGVNSTSGEILLLRRLPRNSDPEFLLCFLASPRLSLYDPSSVSFQKSNLSMMEVKVVVMKEEEEITKEMRMESHKRFIFTSTTKNNTVLALGMAELLCALVDKTCYG